MNIELLKNRSQPPGGWSYWCPKGQMDFPGGFAFDVQVGKIRAYRAANPGLNLPSDLGAVRHALLLHTFLRLRKQQGLETTMAWFSVTDTDDAEINELIKKKQQNLPSDPVIESAKPAGIIETVKQLSTGAQTLTDWLGEGAMPVSPKLAGKRANTCRKCPLNGSGNWLQRLASAVAGVVKQQVELKNEMSLHVKNEDELGICSACGCAIQLKVWVPLETILQDTTQEVMAKLHEKCWITAEAAK